MNWQWPPEIPPSARPVAPDGLAARSVAVPRGVHFETVRDALLRAGVTITGAQSGMDGQSYTVKAEDVDRARGLVALLQSV